MLTVKVVVINQVFKQLVRLSSFTGPEREALGKTDADCAVGARAESQAQSGVFFSFVLALILSLIILALRFYMGRFHYASGNVPHRMPFVLAVLATAVVFYCGFPILRLGWISLSSRTPRTESLLSLAVLAAYFLSAVQMLRGASHVYFDTASVIVTLLLACKLIERNAKRKASHWVTLLRRLAPSRVSLLSENEEQYITLDELRPGQSFFVRPGERFATDGVVEDGESHADESLLTGEWMPVAKASGSQVIAGSLNLDDMLRVRATHHASECTLARMVELAEAALSNRSDLQRSLDRLSLFFVPCIFAVALITFAVCWLGNFTTFDSALLRGITVLLIAAPCALALAAPLAVTAALGSAASRGILIANPRALETMRHVKHFVLDKTGTMTDGDFRLFGCELDPNFSSSPAWMQANAANADQDSLPADFPFNITGPCYEHTFALLASLEQYSEHPLGKAVVQFTRENQIALGKATCVEIHEGLGITGIVDNKSMFIGGRRLIANLAVAIDTRSELIARRWESEGQTVAFFGWDGGLRGCLSFGNSLRAHAQFFIADLSRRGIQMHLLSGDSRITTEAVARQVGLTSIRADLLPNQKAEAVRQWKHQGEMLAMIADGVSDATALAEANIGIAMGSVTGIARPAPSVVLLNNDLRKIPELLDLSKRTMRIIRQNLVWAACFNTAGIALAITGLINPMVAAAAMVLSTLAVVKNSLRIRRATSAN